MQIRILNKDLCETCLNRTCAFVDARVKEMFYSIRTETTVCPQSILIDKTEQSSFTERCINCALCVKNCYANNLEIVEYSQDFDIANLSELQYNAIALSYLDSITGFAANTNRNRSMNFDGFLQTSIGEPCIVEVDYNNDSLECCRRLIGAFITYEGHFGTIRNGLIVLQEFPREGSRDVLNVIDKLIKFPTTKDYRIFFCTFSLLRHMMLKLNTKDWGLSDLFLNPREESASEYKQRIFNGSKTERVSSQTYSSPDKIFHANDGEIITIFSEYQEGCIPLYSLRVACGEHEDGELPETEGWIDVSGRGFTPDPKCHFAVHAKGNSMLPKIHDGDICVFEWYSQVGGSREGKIVLNQIKEHDPVFEGPYTIKKYHSEKRQTENGWEHVKIELIPLNKDYQVIELNEENEYRTIGVLKCVL